MRRKDPVAAEAASGAATASVAARPAGRGGRGRRRPRLSRPRGGSDDARRHHGMAMHNLFSIIWFFFCRENARHQI